jgi:hypothetical protein
VLLKISFARVLEQLSVRFQEGQGMESDTPQLVLLFAMNGNPFRREERFSAPLDRDANIIKAWTERQKDYE